MTDAYQFDPDGDDVVSREVIEHSIPMTDRSVARSIALQCLFEVDIVAHPVEEVLWFHISKNDLNLNIRKQIEHMVLGVADKMTKFDEILQTFAPEWPIKQLAPIDRNILRLALFELTYRAVSVSVVIDEAVALADLYGADGSARFINGVLGTVADHVPAIREELGVTEADL